MKEREVRPLYAPPQARDLRGHSVSGGPLGVCQAGPYPYYNCVTGPGYYPECNPGGTVDVSDCSVGGIHTYPACKGGGVAFTGCLSGAHQNF